MWHADRCGEHASGGDVDVVSCAGEPDGARADVEGFGVLAVDVLRRPVGARRQSSLHDSDPVPGV